MVITYGNLDEGIETVTTILQNKKTNTEYTLNIKDDDLVNNDIFYTDANGMFTVPRKRGYSPTYDMACSDGSKPCGFFPMVSYAFLEDIFVSEKKLM